MMTCHLLIRPAATCTVPRTQLLAASCRHVAASYWTAASDVAPTSARSSPSVNDGQHRRSTTVNAAGHGQRRRFTVVIGGQPRRSTTVNAVATGQRRRITVVIGGQQWRSTTVAGGEPPLTAAGPSLTTTGPPVNGGWWAGQCLELGRSGSGLGRVWIGSGQGPPRGMPRVSHVCPRGIHVDADVDNVH
nr:hypothetical protein [Tanacetum cinerariifolium]